MSEQRSAIMCNKFILNIGKIESMILICMIPLYGSCNNFFSRLITVGSKNQELTQHKCYIFTAYPYYTITLLLHYHKPTPFHLLFIFFSNICVL